MKMLLAPLAFLYGIVIAIRHRLFDWGVLRSKEYDIPIVCVGNITVGGTGKTPVTEFLVEQLSDQYHIAVLSRGYGRRTKGYLEAETKSSYLSVGDEPKQIKQRFPHIVVAVCEKRIKGIEAIRAAHPQVNLIILDDGFQHRWVEPWINIVLMDYNRPIYTDHLLPWGQLRDSVSQLDRAHFVVVTKCPPEISPLDLRLVGKYLELSTYQGLYFTHMLSEELKPVFGDDIVGRVRDGDNIIALSGIGNPTSFVDGLKRRYNVVGEMSLEDHHIYRKKDMVMLEDMLKDSPKDTIIVTTVKDAVKLTNREKIPISVRKRLYYSPISIRFMNDSEKMFIHKLNEYVRTNPKYSLIHK